MMSSPMLDEFCKTYAGALESTRMSETDSFDMSWLGMPIGRKNCPPQTYNFYLILGDSIAKQLVHRERMDKKRHFEK